MAILEVRNVMWESIANLVAEPQTFPGSYWETLMILQNLRTNKESRISMPKGVSSIKGNSML